MGLTQAGCTRTEHRLPGIAPKLLHPLVWDLWAHYLSLSVTAHEETMLLPAAEGWYDKQDGNTQSVQQRAWRDADTDI